MVTSGGQEAQDKRTSCFPALWVDRSESHFKRLLRRFHGAQCVTRCGGSLSVHNSLSPGSQSPDTQACLHLCVPLRQAPILKATCKEKAGPSFNPGPSSSYGVLGTSANPPLG